MNGETEVIAPMEATVELFRSAIIVKWTHTYSFSIVLPIRQRLIQSVFNAKVTVQDRLYFELFTAEVDNLDSSSRHLFKARLEVLTPLIQPLHALEVSASFPFSVSLFQTEIELLKKARIVFPISTTFVAEHSQGIGKFAVEHILPTNFTFSAEIIVLKFAEIPITALSSQIIFPLENKDTFVFRVDNELILQNLISTLTCFSLFYGGREITSLFGADVTYQAQLITPLFGITGEKNRRKIRMMRKRGKL